MKRRHFLFGLSSVAAMSVVGTYLYSTRDIEYDPIIAEPFFLSHIWDTDSIIDMGKKYLSVVKDENTDQKLAKQILNDDGERGVESIYRINEQITNDFKNDRTILVDGWILSLTEARQCGLYSLIQKT